MNKNITAYTCLLIKGELIVNCLQEWVDENVAEVKAIQKKIEISNEEGDTFVGYLDFVIVNKEGKTILVDLKTSSNPSAYYPEDSANNSRQLGIYSQEEEISDVAYLVIDKTMRVKYPKVRLHFIEGVITEEHLDEVFYQIEKVTENIKEKLELGEGAFNWNKDSCSKFGGCEYSQYCWKGKKDKLEEV